MAITGDPKFSELEQRITYIETQTGTAPTEYEEVEVQTYSPGVYVYRGTFVVSFGARVAPPGTSCFIAKLWANGEIVFDGSSGFIKPGFNFQFFDGNENQGEVFRGMHYRGLMTCLFSNCDLSDFGGNIPAITAEIVDGEGSLGSSKCGQLTAANGALTNSLYLYSEQGQLYRSSLYYGYGGTAPIWELPVTHDRVNLGTGIADISTTATGVIGRSIMVPGANMIVTITPETGFSSTGTEIRYYDQVGGVQNYVQRMVVPELDIEPVSMTYVPVTANGVTLNYVLFSGAQPYVNGVRLMEVRRDAMPVIFTGLLPELFDAYNSQITFVVGPKSGGATTVYAMTAAKVCRFVISPGNMQVIPDFYEVPSGRQINNAYYDQPNNRLILLLRTGYGMSPGNAIALNADGTEAWYSEEFAIPMPRVSEQSMEEATSDLTGGKLVVPRGANPAQVSIIDTKTGDVAALNLASPCVTVQKAIWDGRTNRLYSENLTYVEIDVAPSFNPDDSYNMDEIIRSYAAFVGYTDGEIITTRLDHMPVIGYVASGSTTLTQIASALGQVYDFGWFEYGDSLYFKSNYTVEGQLVIDAELTEERLAYLTEGKTDTSKVALTRRSDAELPAKISLSYFDIDNEYKAGQQSIARGGAPLPTSGAVGVLDLSLPITMTGEQAQGLLFRLLRRVWVGRTAFGVRATSEAGLVQPGDALNLTVEGFTYQVTVNEIRWNGDFSVSLGVSEIISDRYPSPVQVQPPRVVTSSNRPVNYVAFDMPDIYPNWTTGGFVNLAVGVGAYKGELFGGAAFELSRSGAGSDWDGQLTFNADEESYIGSTVSALDPWPQPFEKDTLNSIYITQGNIPTERLTDLSDINKNQIVIGQGSLVEIINFESAEYIGDDIWRLYNLWRGRNGTDALIGQAPVGSAIALTDSLKRVLVSKDDYLARTTLYYRALGFKQPLWSATSKSITIEGNSRKPYAPVNVIAERESDSTLYVTWLRRVRFNNSPPAVYEPPPPALDEPVERYIIEVYRDPDHTELARTFDIVGSAEVFYSAADQVADGLWLSSTKVYMRIRQVHEFSGNGLLPGFSWGYVVPVVPENAITLGVVYSGGGSLATNLDLTPVADVTLSMSFAGGGEFDAPVTLAHNLAAEFAGGGEFTTNVRNTTFSGVLLTLGADAATTVETTTQPMVFDTVTYNEGNWETPAFSSVIVPAGVTHVDILAGVEITSNINLRSMWIGVALNGQYIGSWAHRDLNSGGYAVNRRMAYLTHVPVSPGDIISVSWQKFNNLSLGPISGNFTFLAVNAVE